MLEKVMELHFLLYAMMLMGGLGALGMLTTHLTYRRMIRKNTEVKSNLKDISFFDESIPKICFSVSPPPLANKISFFSIAGVSIGKN